ncbi:MAG: transposase [Candidatus Omnitrophica bacterium]|nr:transposase [Candidatus Omnitrophota bacterium]
MPAGPRLLIEHACYHITTRGNQRQPVFLDQKDYRVYLTQLCKYKKQCGFLLYGFCLMPNHLHIIGEPKVQENLAKFMQKLSRSYTAYFNKRYKKVGHLWQGRFKSKAIIKDGYLIDCIQYVEMNPVRAGLVKSASDYPWSSHRERVLTETLHNRKMLDKLTL